MVPITALAAEEVTINDISSVSLGNTVQIAGTSSLKQLVIYIFRPNGSVYDTDSLTTGSDNKFSYSVKISSDEVTGKYSVKVGQGTVYSSKEFSVTAATSGGDTSPGGGTVVQNPETTVEIKPGAEIKPEDEKKIQDQLSKIDDKLKGTDSQVALGVKDSLKTIGDLLSAVNGAANGQSKDKLIADISNAAKKVFAAAENIKDTASANTAASSIADTFKGLSASTNLSSSSADEIAKLAKQATSAVTKLLDNMSLESAVETVQNLISNSSSMLSAISSSQANSNSLIKGLEKLASAAVAKAATKSVEAKEEGGKAVVSADSFKKDDVLALVSKANELSSKLAKQAGTTQLDIKTKVVLDVKTKGTPSNISAEVSSDILKAVTDNNIDQIAISSANGEIAFSPESIPGVDSAKGIVLDSGKLAPNDELLSKLSAEDKSKISKDTVIYDFNMYLTSENGEKTKVTNFNSNIDISIDYAPAPGEDTEKITIFYLADDGTIQNMIGKYDEDTGKVKFQTLHFSKYAIVLNEVTFSDVAESSWAKNFIEVLAAKGIITGNKGRFMPANNVTRAEFAKMLVNAAGIYDETATCDFKDVTKDKWYYSYVASAYKAGIVKGNAGSYGPNDYITREQMAVMVANAANAKAVTNSGLSKFTDASKVSSWAKAQMGFVVANEFMSGYDGKLNPQGYTTRDMAAKVIYNYYNFK